MFKIRYSFLFLIVCLLAVLSITTSCSKAECKIASDCGQQTCSSASCSDKKCVYNPIPNCCGNKIKDSIEDGKPGNSCTCPQDYGACSGKAKIEIGSRTTESEYLQKFCQNEECILGVPPKKVRPITLLDENDFGFFILETTATYSEPFDVSRNTFAFRLSLKDDDLDLILPIKINKILLTDGEVLFGEKEVSATINEVGDTITINVPVSYILQQPEEIRGLTYKISYEYEKRVKDKRLEDGTYSYKPELVRDDYQKRFSTKITFVKTGEE
ncbi:hypothetical protein ISS07_05415 [Candidatus Woesearchaeota archaeon]|nr:hypothetical protein [Candidatus Woesearchaeota archaeon]